MRVAAVGDIHIGCEPDPVFATDVAQLHEHADVLLLAGDLTRVGSADEASCLAQILGRARVPVVAVLGNHDLHCDQSGAVVSALRGADVAVLEGDAVELDLDSGHLGVAGVKGFGGGFAGACGSEFGEPEMKAFMRHTREIADGLGDALRSLDADVRVALTHYSPVEDTLRGERLEIYPFLGSYLLAEAIDEGGADLALHGHAHRGAERGVTPGGVRVRNVARPLIRRSYQLFELEPARSLPLERAGAGGSFQGGAGR
jgi:Icc-related predicted phosphoesterase